jgi:hypothetical protein
MFTLEISAAFVTAGLFALFATIVACDIYSAIGLRRLLNRAASPRKLHRATPTAQNTRFGIAVSPKAAARERRPKTLWVARFASLEQKP